MRFPLTPSTVGVLFASLIILPAHATTVLDFEGFGTGRIIDNQYAGVSISAQNNGSGPDVAITFDTNNPTGGDFDLAAPFFTGQGADPYFPDHVLIIQERNDCNFDTGFCKTPDDEADGGVFSFVFDTVVTLESVEFFDIEINENNNNPDSEIHLFDASDNEILAGNFFVPFTGGDNTWKQLAFGVDSVKRIEIEFKGSGAIDNVTYVGASAVPIPAGGLLFLSGLLGLGVFARKKG